MDTTGGFTSTQLLAEENILTIPSFDISDALEIGEITKSLSAARNLPVVIEVRIDDWIFYHASLPGSKPEKVWWMPSFFAFSAKNASPCVLFSLKAAFFFSSKYCGVKIFASSGVKAVVSLLKTA